MINIFFFFNLHSLDLLHHFQKHKGILLKFFYINIGSFLLYVINLISLLHDP